jgi:positive regulator of sigma E activity
MSQFIPTLWILPVLFLLISLILNAALYSREVAILIASFVNTDLRYTNLK